MESTSNAAGHSITEFANLIILGFCCGLRGDEIVKVDVAAFLKYMRVEAKHDKYPHVVSPLLGRLKGEMGRERWVVGERSTI